ncbi:MAG: hypothetical protein KDC46_08090 [Thermoleophilia bacterium]|nr:hypothetical protein [Thermoleophilia bacterium]
MRVTSLARSVVPWHPATAWALLASAIVFVSAGTSHGFHSGVRGGIATFLAWAIVREIAPRRAIASALAPFAAVPFAIPAQTDLLSCVGALLAARIAVRSVGDPPTAFDCIALVGLAGWLATRLPGLPVAIVLAAVTFADSRDARRSRLAGAAMLAAAIVVGSTEGTLTFRPGWDDHAMGAQVLLGLLLVTAPVLLAWPLPSRLRARDDRGHGPLRGDRVRSGRIAVVAAVAAAVAWTGTDGAFELSSASAAIVAATIAWPGVRRADSSRARY